MKIAQVSETFAVAPQILPEDMPALAEAGYRTVITSSSDEKLARAKTMGADTLINYRTTPEWAKAVREATHGVGADFVMEVGGAGPIQESRKAVRRGGPIAIIGVVAGAGEGVNPGVLIGNSARLQGLSVGSREMFEAMCRAIELHRISPVVDKVFPWTEAAAAFAAIHFFSRIARIPERSRQATVNSRWSTQSIPTRASAAEPSQSMTAQRDHAKSTGHHTTSTERSPSWPSGIPPTTINGSGLPLRAFA